MSLDQQTTVVTGATVAPVTSAFPAPVPDGDQGPGRRGWIFAGIWLVFLSSSFQAAAAVDGAGRRATGIGLLVLFSLAYLFVFVQARRARWSEQGILPAPQQWALFGLLAALTVAAFVVVGQPAENLLVFLGVSAIVVVGGRRAWILVALIIGANEIASRNVPGWTPDDGSMAFSVFLGALALWGITQMIKRNQQLALAQEENAELAVAAERTRFARDLHDLLGHSLTVITVKTELAGRLVSIDPVRAEQEIADVERLARDALADVRSAVAGYREVSLARELVSARTALTAAGITPDLPTAVDAVPGERRELFGWAVREGVTNVMRHSGATVCRITVDGDGVEIVDDGRGPTAGGVGNGLAGLSERASEAGAGVVVGRGPEGGFRLRVGW